jgi:hypothetical protein
MFKRVFQSLKCLFLGHNLGFVTESRKSNFLGISMAYKVTTKRCIRCGRYP